VMMGNYFNALADLNEPSLAQAAREIANWIQTHFSQSKRWVLGGFSQGSMVALRAAIQESIQLSGVLILSGSLIDKVGTQQLLDTATKVPCFQSHGTADQVLGIENAKALNQLLLENNWPVEWHSFPGGHEIPPVIMLKLRDFLKQFNVSR